MADDKSIEPQEERALKSKELEMRVQHYKHYITVALQANIFYYVTTGGVLAFYLKYTFEEKPIPNLEFFLLLPIFFGSFLGGIFFYGAGLQIKAVESLDDVRDELRNRLGLSIKKFYDAHLLIILLWIFSVIFFLVVLSLLILPFLLRPIIFSDLFTPIALAIPSNMQIFYLVSTFILIAGLSIPLIAGLLERNLKKRRNINWLRTVLRARLWLGKQSDVLDISELEEQNFYYALRPFLDKKTLESIDKKEKKLAKVLLNEKIDEFFTKLERKYILQPEILGKMRAEVEQETVLLNSLPRRLITALALLMRRRF